MKRFCDDCGDPVVGRPGDHAHYCYDCGRARVAYRDALGFDVAASWEEIAAELGVTRQRVQQIYAGALAKLKKLHGVELRHVLVAMKQVEPKGHIGQIRGVYRPFDSLDIGNAA